jgi:hypothetical protein
VISHPEKNLTFLASPKAGSTSLTKILPPLGFRLYPGTAKHESLYVPDMNYFCMVRNHFDAITSWCFFAKGIKGPPFKLKNLKDFVADHPHYFGGWPLFEGFRSDMTALWRWVGTDYNPTVLYFENFPGCAEEFLGMWGFDVPEIPHLNKSLNREGRHYSEALEPDVIQWIQDRWGREMEELGYA